MASSAHEECIAELKQILSVSFKSHDIVEEVRYWWEHANCCDYCRRIGQDLHSLLVDWKNDGVLDAFLDDD